MVVVVMMVMRMMMVMRIISGLSLLSRVVALNLGAMRPDTHHQVLTL